MDRPQTISAVSILRQDGNRYDVIHLERLPLDMPYPKQIEYLFQIRHKKPLDKANVVLAIDYTGVGRPIWDLAKDRGLKSNWDSYYWRQYC